MQFQVHGCRFSRLLSLHRRRAIARQAPSAAEDHRHFAHRFYTSNPAATDHFYRNQSGAVKLADPENPKGVRYAISATQFIEVLPLPADAGINRLDHTAWNTDDAEAMRRYLGSKAWKVPGQVEKGATAAAGSRPRTRKATR
jgi:hypothetical protein